MVARNEAHAGVDRLHTGARTAWQVIIQSGRDLWAGSVLEWAASIAFYALLSLFPLLISLLVVASWVVDGAWATQHAITLLGHYLPGGEPEITGIIESALAQRRHVGILSLAIFLFTGRRVLGVLTKALNHVSDVDEHRDPYARRIAVELALLGGIVTLGIIAVAAQPLMRWSWEVSGILPGPDNLAARSVQGFGRILVLLTVFVLVYLYVPRGERRWRAAFTGAAIATIMFLVAEGVFTLVLDRIWSSLSLIYGPLALAALLLLWAWYVSLITLIGGGVASHVKVMVMERESGQQAEARHARR